MIGARRAAYWIFPSLLCLALYWRGFTAWFRADDFAWILLAQQVHDFRSLLHALFSPAAQGTIHAWSGRLFFLAGYDWFGLDSVPFRVVIFATQFANLVLVTVLGNRIAGNRQAGFWAAILWVLNSALVYPLGWVCVYNQVMVAFFLLLTLYLTWDHSVLRPSAVAAFVIGFGAQEINLVYPAIAAAYCLVWRRKDLLRTLPLFALSVIYVIVHNVVAPVHKTGTYAMHYTGSVLGTLAKYWLWAMGPMWLEEPFRVPGWVLAIGAVAVSLGLLAFAVGKGRRAGFCVAWFVITIAPVLPMRDHMTEYYLYVPAIGLCWLGGWALAEAPRRVVAVALAVLYVAMAVPRVLAGSERNYRIAGRVKNLVEGVARVHELHPGKAVLLDGVDEDLFWSGILDHPFQVIGVDQVYLTSGTLPGIGDAREFVLAPALAAQGLTRGEAVVYDVRGPQLRNITNNYAATLQQVPPPANVDVSNPLAFSFLGPEWYGIDGNHRWMARRASVRIAAPANAGQKLYLRGYCPKEQFHAAVSVTVDGMALTRAPVETESFELAFALPAAVVGRPSMEVAIEVSRTFRASGDPRELGLAFGTLEVR